jgi:hypothetical protein
VENGENFPQLPTTESTFPASGSVTVFWQHFCLTITLLLYQEQTALPTNPQAAILLSIISGGLSNLQSLLSPPFNLYTTPQSTFRQLARENISRDPRAKENTFIRSSSPKQFTSNFREVEWRDSKSSKKNVGKKFHQFLMFFRLGENRIFHFRVLR